MQLGFETTGRSAKSTRSIVEKLRRESIRLTQVQDIAGCRLVVADVTEQERVLESMRVVFPSLDVVDRRTSPSHGYRAIHVIVRGFSKQVEVQVRTSLQHLWAELSEKLSDTLDPSIKYGGGPESIRNVLAAVSRSVRGVEEVEALIVSLSAGEVGETQVEMARAVQQLGEARSDVRGLLEEMIAMLPTERRQSS